MASRISNRMAGYRDAGYLANMQVGTGKQKQTPETFFYWKTQVVYDEEQHVRYFFF